MTDPFATLKTALKPILMRNSKNIYPEIQYLQALLEQPPPNDKESFKGLLKAVTETLTYIEQWRVDFNTIRMPLETLNKKLGLEPIKWDIYLSRSKASPRFQFGALNPKTQEIGFLPWLEKHSESNTQTMVERLIKLRKNPGFYQKLSMHLEKDPEFLFRLIMESEENFIAITGTKLILYLTDKQLAEAIIKHIPHFVQHNSNSLLQATQLVETLNDTLSNGRSVSTLFHQAEAYLVLISSELLRMYVGAENQEATINPPTSLPEEEGGAKPNI